MSGFKRAEESPAGLLDRLGSAGPAVQLPAGVGNVPHVGRGRVKKTLNISVNEPKAWPNMRKEFFLDNHSDAWDVVRDFYRGRKYTP